MRLRSSGLHLFSFTWAFALAAPTPSVLNLQSEAQLLEWASASAYSPGRARAGERVVLDTGAPSTSLPTGTVIFQKQSSAIQFNVPRTFQTAVRDEESTVDALVREETTSLRKRTYAQLISAEFILGALQSTNADVYIQICADVGGTPGGKWDLKWNGRTENRRTKRNGCLAYETLHVDGSARRVTVHWEPKEQVQLEIGGTYWLALSSNAPSFTESVSWFDSDHGTAVTGFKVVGSGWQVSELQGASTAKIVVKM